MVYTGPVMPIHRIHWTTTVAGTQSVSVLEDALKWLSGPDSVSNNEKDKSWYGSQINSLSSVVEKKKSCTNCLVKLGSANLKKISNELEDRLDDQKQLHIRLCQNELVKGNFILLNKSEKRPVFKGRVKFVVYPNENLHEIVKSEIEKAIRICENQ